MSGVEIRAASVDDAEVIFGFIRELAEYEREPDAVKTSPAVLRQQLASGSPPFECVIAESNVEPLGFALFFHNYSTWRGRPGLYLEDLFVPERFRRRGVGLALLKHLARLAVARDCARMEWSVLNWNEPAIRFYRSLGASPMDGWTTFRLTDDALLKLGAA